MAGAAVLMVACSSGTPPQVSKAPPRSTEQHEQHEQHEAEESSAGVASSASASAEPAEDEAPREVPTACSKAEGACTPDPKWVERLCRASYPSVALALFAKGSPWTRGYLTRNTEAWNAAGGASEAAQLKFDEEVLVLVERTANPNGIQVSGAGGGYEALRWDGGCVTLSKEELTLKRPPQPLTAKVEWRHLDQSTRDALSADEKVKKAFQERRNECKGATSGEVSLKCVKADSKLSEIIVQHVRNGGELGKPEKRP